MAETLKGLKRTHYCGDLRATDEGGRKQALIRDLCALVEAYQTGVIPQGVAQEQ